MTTPLHGSHQLARWHIVVLTYGCDTCGAPPGQQCVTSSGREKTTEVHVARSSAAARRYWVPGDLPSACIECGNDDATEGWPFCADCLEKGVDT